MQLVKNFYILMQKKKGCNNMYLTATAHWLLFLAKQWKEITAIFLLKNFKLFFWVTLNAFLKGLRIFLRHAWWLIISCVIVILLIPQLNIFYIVVQPLLLAYMILSVRPSVAIKNNAYFMHYLPQAYLGLLVGKISLVLLGNIFFPFLLLLQPWYAIGGISLSLVDALRLLEFPTLIWMGFFLLDQAPGLGIWSSIKMTVYTFPVYFLTQLFIGAVLLIGASLLLVLLPPATAFTCIFFYAIILDLCLSCWVNTIYIKKAHEDFALYF